MVVTLVAISLDGSMMCTAERKLPEEGIGGLLCLKFWSSDSMKKEFNLSTIVYDPHGSVSIFILYSFNVYYTLPYNLYL